MDGFTEAQEFVLDIYAYKARHNRQANKQVTAPVARGFVTDLYETVVAIEPNCGKGLIRGRCSR